MSRRAGCPRATAAPRLANLRSTSPLCRWTTRRPTNCSRAAIRWRCSSSNRAACASCSSAPGRTLRGHHRAGRAVPPRPAGQRDGQRMVRPQARPRRGQLSASRAGAGAGADLRRDRVPGTGDADRPGPGRLFAGRRRPAAPRDGQEESRGDGEGTRQVRGRRGRARRRSAHGDADLRPDGEVRRVRLQQVALRRLRAGRLPDRVAEGALPGRVHGRGAVLGHGQHRQGGRLPRRGARARPQRAAAGRECVEPHVRGHRRQDHPLRPGRGQGRRPRCLRGDRGRARTRGAVPRTCSISASAWMRPASTSARWRRWSMPARWMRWRRTAPR